MPCTRACGHNRSLTISVGFLPNFPAQKQGRACHSQGQKVLIKMKKDQCPEVIYESHLEFAISFGLKFGHIFHGVECGMYEFEKRNETGPYFPRNERTRHVKPPVIIGVYKNGVHIGCYLSSKKIRSFRYDFRKLNANS